MDMLFKAQPNQCRLAEYQITENLPKNIKTALRTIEELEAKSSKTPDKEK